MGYMYTQADKKINADECYAMLLLCGQECMSIVYIRTHTHRHELNLSATESSVTLIPHYRPMPDHNPKAFRVSQKNKNDRV